MSRVTKRSLPKKFKWIKQDDSQLQNLVDPKGNILGEMFYDSWRQVYSFCWENQTSSCLVDPEFVGNNITLLKNQISDYLHDLMGRNNGNVYENILLDEIEHLQENAGSIISITKDSMTAYKTVVIVDSELLALRLGYYYRKHKYQIVPVRRGEFKGMFKFEHYPHMDWNFRLGKKQELLTYRNYVLTTNKNSLF